MQQLVSWQLFCLLSHFSLLALHWIKAESHKIEMVFYLVLNINSMKRILAVNDNMAKQFSSYFMRG